MATQADIEETYNYMDDLWRASFGDHPDISCAYFDGDFTKTLEQAQRAKHDFILDSLHVGPGTRVLDVGCGWGPLLNVIRERGAHGIGITLSTRQMEACRRRDLEAHILDWRDIAADTFGTFDAIAVVGALEHWCSPEQYAAGEQDGIYRSFFALAHELLPAHGRMYVQSMVWGQEAPPFETISFDAPKGSAAYIAAVLGTFYPGSYAAFGEEHISCCAQPWFEVIATSSGRLDYLETMKRWGALYDLSPRKLLLAAKLIIPYFTDRRFRLKIQSILGSYNTECFRREIMDLSRIVFERV